ncbi:hypothetical protein AB0K00_17510 [Dactylosporangium sp. NPDC049525]|uniref:hypothetical protein n=1 Tax=Dactylosporangium sp. NPDC049525 TaxID=3154730 RepID=UPI00342C469D
MADHPVVAAARGRKGRVYQFSLTLLPHQGEQPKHRTYPTKADDDPSSILSELADMGWIPVSMSTVSFPDSSAVLCVYVFRR